MAEVVHGPALEPELGHHPPGRSGVPDQHRTSPGRGLQREPERRAFVEAIEAADARLMSVATFVEISIVIEVRHGAEGLRNVEHFIARAGIELVPVDAEHGKVACSAFSRFGKGRHPAGLNYGDCFAYALAKQHSAPLLYIGNDFGLTDIASALEAALQAIVEWVVGGAAASMSASNTPHGYALYFFTRRALKLLEG
jgi:ribonuclease VapC